MGVVGFVRVLNLGGGEEAGGSDGRPGFDGGIIDSDADEGGGGHRGQIGLGNFVWVSGALELRSYHGFLLRV